MTMTEPSTTDTEPTAFSVFLEQHAKGRTHDELSEKLRDVIKAVQDIGKNGTLTLKLTAKHITDGQVGIEAAVTTKLPDVAQASIWFASDEGELTRDDPTQMDYFKQENSDR